MFLVFNKEKIYAYVVSILTVCLLFFTANAMNKTDENTQMTSSATEKLLPEEKKVAFTMNCAWNADDIDSILKTLDDNNVKITFFMVGDWVDKYPKKVEEIAKRGHEIRKP